jgi:hypothetical protein
MNIIRGAVVTAAPLAYSAEGHFSVIRHKNQIRGKNNLGGDENRKE